MPIDIAKLAARIGEEFGPGDWVSVDQPMIDAYAEMTGDRQWIHVDSLRAQAESPFGGTIAHGLLIVSLVPAMVERAPWLEAKIGVNYGADRMRFIAPVRAGSRVRARARLSSVEPYGDGGAKLGTSVTVEVEGGDRPACVVEMIGIVMA